MFALQEVVKSIKSFTFELAFKVIIKLVHLGLAHLDCLNKVTNIDIHPWAYLINMGMNSKSGKMQWKPRINSISIIFYMLNLATPPL
jgi:hypothetical protein